MADISKVNIGGVTYNIKDRQARLDIESLQSSLTGAMHYIGTTIDPTSIADNSKAVAYVKTDDENATAIGFLHRYCSYHYNVHLQWCYVQRYI